MATISYCVIFLYNVHVSLTTSLFYVFLIFDMYLVFYRLRKSFFMFLTWIIYTYQQYKNFVKMNNLKYVKKHKLARFSWVYKNFKK